MASVSLRPALPVPAADMLAETAVGRYKVQVFWHTFFGRRSIGGRLLLDGQELHPRTRAEEGRYPKKAGMALYRLCRHFREQYGLDPDA